MRGAEAHGIRPGKAERFESVTGQGDRGRIDGREVTLGNAAVMDAPAEPLGIDEGIAGGMPDGKAAKVHEIQSQGRRWPWR